MLQQIGSLEHIGALSREVSRLEGVKRLAQTMGRKNLASMAQRRIDATHKALGLAIDAWKLNCKEAN